MASHKTIVRLIGAVAIAAIVAVVWWYGIAEAPVPGIEPDTSWRWLNTKVSDTLLILPHNPQPFIVTFAADGTVSVSGDCNSMSGEYDFRSSDRISISSLAMTKMACEGSQEGEFIRDFEQVRSYEVHGVTLRLFMSDDTFMMFTRAG